MRIATAFLTAALLGALTLGTAQAQEQPGQLAAQDATGAISGVIVYDGRPEIPYEFEVIVVPADLPQPISFLDAGQYAYNNDHSGSFSVTGLAAGEYLVGVLANPDYTPSLTEMIVILDDRENDLGLRQRSLGYPATRVRVRTGQTTDIEIRIALPVFPTVEPITTLPGLARGAGSISGRISPQLCNRCNGGFFLVVIPADLGRALDLGKQDYETYKMLTDIHGFYTVTDIADGEYLVAPLIGGQEYATSLSEKVPYTLGTRQADLPARRVRITNGEAVTGVDFLFKEPPPAIFSSELPVAQEDDISDLPAAQGDDITLATVASYVGVAIAALTVLALAGGVALRVRGSRSR